MWGIVFVMSVAAGGLCLLGFLQDWVLNANSSLDLEELDRSIEAAGKEVTRTANILYDWPSRETRDDWVRAVDYREGLVQERNRYV